MRRPDVLNVPVDGLPDVRFDVLHDLGASQKLVHYSLDHREVVVLLEQLTDGLVDCPLHDLAEVGFRIVYRQPLPTPRGENVQVQ